MVDLNLKFELTKDMPLIKKEIISHLFDYISTKPFNYWYKYAGEFSYDGVKYNLECECKMDRQMFTYKNLFIEHQQQIIDVDEMIRKGLIN